MRHQEGQGRGFQGTQDEVQEEKDNENLITETDNHEWYNYLINQTKKMFVITIISDGDDADYSNIISDYRERGLTIMTYDFPKLDLHFHLDGSMIPEVTWKLAAERNVKLPADNIEEFKEFLARTADCGDVGEYLARFSMPTEILQDKAALYETTYSIIELIAKIGLVYTEIRFAPQLHILKGLTQADAIDAVLEAKKDAERDNPSIKIGIILCCMIAPNNENRELSRLRWDIVEFESSIRNNQKHSREQYRHVLDTGRKFERLIETSDNLIVDEEDVRAIRESLVIINEHYEKNRLNQSAVSF